MTLKTEWNSKKNKTFRAKKKMGAAHKTKTKLIIEDKFFQNDGKKM